MDTLWSFNTPQHFWQCQPNPPEEIWQDAIRKSIPILELREGKYDSESIPALILGEKRFGPDHWRLGKLKLFYYSIKSILPRSVIIKLRKLYHRNITKQENWPVDDRYVRYLWEVMRQVLILNGQKELTIRYFWPKHRLFAFVLTHDIETSDGQEYVEAVADLEESLGFRSLFHFVPEKYELNYTLMENLRKRGFEVGVHGLKHDGKLFESKSKFTQNAIRINRYLKEWNTTGFRAELTLRQPEWMQELNIEYDLSFFDVDPFEPIPGGTMSIWPFTIGHFMELPYTLVQDHTLTTILKMFTPQIWLEKVEFIEKYHGMALVDTHPDYLKSKHTWNVYYEFLNEMKSRDSYWHALPGDVVKWWRTRSTPDDETCNSLPFAKVNLADDDVHISFTCEVDNIHGLN